jgi:hypothetical protein
MYGGGGIVGIVFVALVVFSRWSYLGDRVRVGYGSC